MVSWFFSMFLCLFYACGSRLDGLKIHTCWGPIPRYVDSEAQWNLGIFLLFNVLRVILPKSHFPTLLAYCKV